MEAEAGAAASSQALVSLDPEEERRRKADEENDILQRRIEALVKKLDPVEKKKKPRSRSSSAASSGDSDSSASASSRPAQPSAKRRRASRDEALQQPVTPIATPPEKEAEAEAQLRASNAENPSAEPSAVDFWRRMKSGDIHPADLRDGVQTLLQGNSLLLQEEPGSAGQVSLSMVVPALGLRVTTPVPQKLHATAEGRAMAEQLLSAMLLVQLQCLKNAKANGNSCSELPTQNKELMLMCDVLDTLHKGPMSVTDLSGRFAARWGDLKKSLKVKGTTFANWLRQIRVSMPESLKSGGVDLVRLGCPRQVPSRLDAARPKNSARPKAAAGIMVPPRTDLPASPAIPDKPMTSRDRRKQRRAAKYATLKALERVEEDASGPAALPSLNEPPAAQS